MPSSNQRAQGNKRLIVISLEANQPEYQMLFLLLVCVKLTNIETVKSIAIVYLLAVKCFATEFDNLIVGFAVAQQRIIDIRYCIDFNGDKNGFDSLKCTVKHN